MNFDHMSLPKGGAARCVAAAREAKGLRAAEPGLDPEAGLNVTAADAAPEKIAAPHDRGQALLSRAAELGGLTVRGWTRTLRLARTIADLDGATGVGRRQVTQALI